MGIKDRLAQASGPARAMPGLGGDAHYEAVVNKNDVNMSRLTALLNQRWKDGWGLAHIFPEGGNTVMIFERQD